MVRSARRWFKHLCSGSLSRRRAFSSQALKAIEDAISACEGRHAGEIRFAISSSLSLQQLWQGISPRDIAEQAFAQLKVWDTEHNNGVLIYVLLADRDVEIVADRGAGDGRVPKSEWEDCCQTMLAHFQAGRFEEGAVAGINAVAEVLSRYPPETDDAGNEQSNAPDLL